MEKELEELQAMKKRIQASLLNAPEGSLRCTLLKGKYPQYYHVSKENRNQKPQGNYISKQNLDLALHLAQKDYDKKTLGLLQKKEQAIQHFLSHYPEMALDQIYSGLSDLRQKLVTPYFPPDEEYLRTWYQLHPGSQNTFPIANGFMTERKELVRSKSEKIIADKFHYNQIPYVYESALKLNNGKSIYPDFTLMNLSTRKTYYFEHFGKIDDPDYAKKMIEKIETYEANHIYPGETLLISMESSSKPLNIKQVELMLHRYLI